ncbi:MAG: PfkB family carbohydrate kinase [Candidatus Bilamarchaeum sp.]
MSSITCSGSIALDTTRTPFKSVDMVLGGSASYFSLSSSFFAKTYLSSIVGNDFPPHYWDLLSQRCDLESVEKRADEKTFHYDSTFSFDLYQRQTNKTEPNAISFYQSRLSAKAAESPFLFLASLSPTKQLKVLQGSKGRKLVFMDTIEHYIKTEFAALTHLVGLVDGIILNDAEARMITKQSSLVKCGIKIKNMGPKIVIIKKGEHGSLLFFKNNVIPFPAFPLEEIVDPTGAGDSFAGGFIGYLAKHRIYEPSVSQLKIAMAYANVMGSLAVQEFSVDRLVKTTSEEIEELFSSYKNLLHI